MMLHGLFELLITLGDSDTHNANDTCLDISDFRGGDDMMVLVMMRMMMKRRRRRTMSWKNQS